MIRAQAGSRTLSGGGTTRLACVMLCLSFKVYLPILAARAFSASVTNTTLYARPVVLYHKQSDGHVVRRTYLCGRSLRATLDFGRHVCIRISASRRVLALLFPLGTHIVPCRLRVYIRLAGGLDREAFAVCGATGCSQGAPVSVFVSDTVR